MYLWWDAPPIVVPRTDARSIIAPVVISINHRKQFTTKRKFPTRNDLFEWA